MLMVKMYYNNTSVFIFNMSFKFKLSQLQYKFQNTHLMMIAIETLT